MGSRSTSSASSPRQPPSAYVNQDEHHDSSSVCTTEKEDFEEEPEEAFLVQALEYGCMTLCCTTAATLALWILYLGRKGGLEHAHQRRSLELSHSVVTSSGSLRGVWVDDGDNGTVLAFFGVPYAEPPSGRRPVPETHARATVERRAESHVQGALTGSVGNLPQALLQNLPQLYVKPVHANAPLSLAARFAEGAPPSPAVPSERRGEEEAP
ncbi:hypothetical protein MTO96_019265 [Rhipicephalus appendiculatus]